MAYEYYRTSYPGWGQQQLNFGAPPIPNIQPQPHWSGWDYYSAHGINPDPSLFYSIMDRIRGYGLNGGYDKRDARVFHHRIYSGLVPLTQTLPTDIGAAAAYEAYRMWKHHHQILYAQIGGQREREREGLIGLAVAEATHLWQYSGRSMDTYGLRQALESAAMTAARIAYRVLDERDGYFSSRSSVSDYDDYGGGGYSRRRRHSTVGISPTIPPNYGTPYTGTVPMPAVTTVGSAYGTNPYYNPSRNYSTSMVATPTYGGAITPTPYNAPTPVIPGSMGYSTPYAGSQPLYPGTPYRGTVAFPGGTSYASSVIPGAPAGSTVIIQNPSRHRRASSASYAHSGGHHHHRHRSRSPVPGYAGSGYGYR
ncbi:hypothetical protein K474DRAFT_1701409 [Panus rudis PR-1116 ss-1]|nr:hypothetical protein K474DRAFT_1701409 [Panus rudis PR-1116 ss-1]